MLINVIIKLQEIIFQKITSEAKTKIKQNTLMETTYILTKLNDKDLNKLFYLTSQSVDSNDRPISLLNSISWSMYLS